MIDTSPTLENGPFEVSGFRLGHWTHADGSTGCTVIIADHLSPAAVDVRGGSPGTRETNLLGAGMSVQRVDAVVLTGGSAFGLASADGVMRWLHEQHRGYPTSAIPVPIVSAAVIFDLQREDLRWPSAGQGYAAASAASNQWKAGSVGGGAGALVSKALGRELAIKSGVGIAQLSTPAGTVSAIFVNNAVGDVFDETGRPITTPGSGVQTSDVLLSGSGSHPNKGENTVIGVIVIDRPVDHDGLTRIATAGHAGIARVIRPAATPADGDTVFAIAPESEKPTLQELIQLTTATQLVTARALVNAVRSPASREMVQE